MRRAFLLLLSALAVAVRCSHGDDPAGLSRSASHSRRPDSPFPSLFGGRTRKPVRSDPPPPPAAASRPSGPVSGKRGRGPHPNFQPGWMSNLIRTYTIARQSCSLPLQRSLLPRLCSFVSRCVGLSCEYLLPAHHLMPVPGPFGWASVPSPGGLGVPTFAGSDDEFEAFARRLGSEEDPAEDEADEIIARSLEEAEDEDGDVEDEEPDASTGSEDEDVDEDEIMDNSFPTITASRKKRSTYGYGNGLGYGGGYGDGPAYGGGYGDGPAYGGGYGDGPAYGGGYGNGPAYGDGPTYGQGYGNGPVYGQGYVNRPVYGQGYGDGPAYGQGYGNRPAYGQGYGNGPTYGQSYGNGGVYGPTYYPTGTSSGLNSNPYYRYVEAAYVQYKKDQLQEYMDRKTMMANANQQPRGVRYGPSYKPVRNMYPHKSTYEPSYEPQEPTYDPHKPSYEPHKPSYDPHKPSYEPQSDGHGHKSVGNPPKEDGYGSGGSDY